MAGVVGTAVGTARAEDPPAPSPATVAVPRSVAIGSNLPLTKTDRVARQEVIGEAYLRIGAVFDLRSRGSPALRRAAPGPPRQPDAAIHGCSRRARAARSVTGVLSRDFSHSL
jgi:hypothetical protein